LYGCFCLFVHREKESEIRISALYMPLFYQQDINESTRLGVWKIEEDESFFLQELPLQREITHPNKRLQHLAGRYLLRILFNDFPYELIRIADTRKPFLHNEQYHFSISHSGKYAAAIVSSDKRVGIDVECRTPTVMKVLKKFLNDSEMNFLKPENNNRPYMRETLLWSVKETVFKWHGNGGLDFREHILIRDFSCDKSGIISCFFNYEFFAALDVHYRIIDDLCISWLSSRHTE
jgi:4'-phosphopantetheinyl transferase EntD